MNKLQFIYGAAITLALNIVLLITAINEKIITAGYIAAIIILFGFSMIIKVMLANAVKDGQPTNWKNVASYAAGSGTVSIVILILYLLAIS